MSFLLRKEYCSNKLILLSQVPLFNMPFDAEPEPMGLMLVDIVIPAGRMSSCSNLCGSKQTWAAAEGGYQRYGVRSYLHQFYEDCTTTIWEYEDDFQIQRSPNRWSSVFWKVRQNRMFNLGNGTIIRYSEYNTIAEENWEVQNSGVDPSGDMKCSLLPLGK